MLEEIKIFLNNYFTPEELQVMKKIYFHDYEKDDTTINDPEYIDFVNKYKKLLNIKDKKFRIEVDECCSLLMEKLIKRYVSNDTLVIIGQEIKYYINKTIEALPARQILSVNYKKHYIDDDFLSLLKNKIKTNDFKNVFIMLPGVVPGNSIIVSQSEMVRLKNFLINLNIPHIFVLDDCQGLVYTERDYEIFDCILASAHLMFLGFDMGILFTKMSEKIGYCNKTGLKRFYEKLEILSRYKNKGNKLNSLLTKYFNSFLNEPAYVNPVAKNIFCLSLDSKIKIPQQYSAALHYNHLFTFSDVLNDSSNPFRFFRIRLQDLLIQNSDNVLQGLIKTREIFNKIMRLNALSDVHEVRLQKQILSNNNYMAYDILNDFYHFDQFENEQNKIIEQMKENLFRYKLTNIR